MLDDAHVTLIDAFRATAARVPDRIALRTLDGATELTFGAYAARAQALAAGFAALGVRPRDTVAILTVNRPEFHLADTGALLAGATPFSIYATSSPEQIAYLLEHAAPRVLVTERLFLVQVSAACARVAHPPALVVLDGERTLQDVEALGDPAFTTPPLAADDVATLIYTSGTTGPPKGVELTHGNVLAQWRGLAAVLPIRDGGRVISYLPTAHIADRNGAHYAQMLFGLEVTTIPDPRQIAAALPQVRPAMWGAVPRIAEKLAAAIEAGVAGNDVARAALDTGIERVRREVAGEPVDDALAARHAVAENDVLAPLRAKLGLDDADWVMFGAAPLPLAVHELLRGIGLPTTEVYGLSESACVATTYAAHEGRVGTVGRALPGVELALADDGEVLLKGPTIMRGYRGDPDRTAEAVDGDGWLHTGDVGVLDDDGCLRIVDRKKELIVNAAGKNMSPANIEGELKSASPLIGQAAVIGDGRPYNVALLVLDPDAAPGASATDDDILTAVAAAVDAANARLSRVEQVKRWTLLADEWLPGGDELTPTMKLRRKPIAAKYAPEIEALYAHLAVT